MPQHSEARRFSFGGWPTTIAAHDVLAFVEECTDNAHAVDAALVAGRFLLSERAAALQLERLARRGRIAAVDVRRPAWRRSYHVTIRGRARLHHFRQHAPLWAVS